MRTAWRLLTSTTIVAASILMYLVAFAPGAGAQTTGCTATLNGTSIKSYSTPKTALRVSGNGSVAVTGTALDIFFSPGESRSTSYLVKLELAGASWTATSGVARGQTWSGTVNVADYATRGQGIYKVVAVTQSSQGTQCFGRAYVKVEGDSGPLSTTAGQVAAGLGAAGLAGAAAAGARGGREINEEVVGESVVNFLEDQGKTPETTAAEDEKAAREQMNRQHAHELHLMAFCLPLVVVAAVATIRAIASDIGHHVAAAIGGMFR